LSKNTLYSKVLPTKLGYPTFVESLQKYPITKRQADGEYYVRIHKKNGLMLRWEEQKDWKDKMKRDCPKAYDQ